MDIDWKKKFTSRKFWMSVATLVFLVMVFLGADENSSTQICAIIMAGATVIGYVFGEGLADYGSNVGSYGSNEVTIPGVDYPDFTVPGQDSSTDTDGFEKLN